MENDVMRMDFECTHNTVERAMTCSWLGGRIQLIEYFALAKTYVLINGNVMSRYDDLTIDEFIRLQMDCQHTADTFNNKSL